MCSHPRKEGLPMVKAQESVKASDDSPSVYERAKVDPSNFAKVGQHIRTGRRWDITHKDVVGDLVVIMAAKEIKTKYGAAMLCNVVHLGEEKVALMGGQTLIDQLKELLPHLPVCAVVKKPARSYGLFDPTEDDINEYNAKYNA